jgi:hypothetical protein
LPGDWRRVVPVEVDGLTANLLGVEDAIVDRLNALVHWNSVEDGAWAKVLLASARQVDLEYLREQCRAEGVEAALDRVLGGTADGTR